MKLPRRYPGLYLVLCCTTLSGALAQSPPTGMPPPGNRAAGTAPTFTPTYLLASQVDWVLLLSAPPAAGSPEQQRDLQAVLDAQVAARRTPARRQLAIEDSELSCFRYADVLGTAFDEKKLPRTAAFLRTATTDGAAATEQAKTYWHRLRPYIVSNDVEKLADADPVYEQQEKDKRRMKQAEEEQEKARKQLAEGKPVKAREPVDPEVVRKQDLQARQIKDTTSYPSGHAALGTMCATFLGQMLPEKHTELSARAAVYRESRMIVGAHFRTDIDAGSVLATAVAAMMSQNFAFQRDQLEARTELRAALGLPAALPERKSDKDKSADKADKK